MSTSTESSVQTLKFVLRFFGTASLTALFFVAVPFAWMDTIHAMLGMGALADQPVVGYLTRSTSALYALLGGLFWVVSFDLQRHLAVVTYLGFAFCGFGVILLAVDWLEGMPLFWKVWEGLFIIAVGAFILSSTRKIRAGNAKE